MIVKSWIERIGTCSYCPNKAKYRYEIHTFCTKKTGYLCEEHKNKFVIAHQHDLDW